jgi:signal transduction histidine kinase/HAMP domain-containing protein
LTLLPQASTKFLLPNKFMSTNQPAPTTRRPFFHSLRFKVSFFVALVMVMVVLVLSGVLVVSEQRKGSREILDNGQTFANFSARSIYDNYLQLYTHPQKEEFEQFKDRVQSTLDVNEDIVHVSLLGINGRILFDSDEFTAGKYQGSPRLTDDEYTLDNLRQSETTHRDLQGPGGERLTEIIVPLDESGAGHVLSVRYLISYASLSERTREILLQVGSLTLPLLAFVVLVAVLFSITLTRPIVKLTKVAEEIRAGNFEARSNVTTGDEIGTLGATLDEMTAQLRQTYNKLNQSLREVTQRTGQLSEEKARFFASIDSLPLGFMMTDAAGRILVTNPAMQRMLDITDDQPKATGIAEELLAKAKVCLQKKQSMHVPELNQEGKVYRAFLSPVLLSNTPMTAAIGTAILLEDVTEERILARSKDEFFSIASHELRTPLTAIRGNSGMILDYYGDAIKSNEPKDMLTDIHDSSVRLIGIVNDFLDVSRLEQGKMEFKLENIVLHDLAQSVIGELTTIAQNKHIQLTIDPSLTSLPPVLADQNKTKQVLFNLVGNALKFVEKGGITVSAKAQSKVVKIYITDTGKGISPENQSLLFHKFQQAGSSILTRNDSQSTGLGLYISKLLVEKMGGQIKLESSELGKGTTFSFTLPIAKK